MERRTIKGLGKGKKVLRQFCAVFMCLVLFTAIVAAADSYSLEYDRNGNLAGDGEKVYNYNELGRLESVESAEGALIADYFYDESGQRAMKVDYGERVATYYIDELVLQKDLDSNEWDESLYYYQGSELVGKHNSTGMFFYHPNHLGSTDIVTDENGDVIEENEYMPFGGVLEGGEDRFLFTGQEMDQETGLMYYNSRYYSPLFRKFIQPDVVIPNIYDPQSLNRYSYVQNNPVKYNDPSGNIPQVVVGAIVGAVIGAAISIGVQAYYKGVDNIDWGDVGKSAVVGAVAGAVATATFGIGVGALGSGAASYVGAGAATGFVTGRVTQATYNVVNGVPITDNLFNGKDMVRDTALGAVFSGGAYAFQSTKGGATGAVKMANPKSLRPVHGLKSKATLNNYKNSFLKKGYGNTDPIKVVTMKDWSKVIADGHHRTRAAIAAGLDEVPIVEAAASEYPWIERQIGTQVQRATLTKNGMDIASRDYAISKAIRFAEVNK